LKCYVTAPQYDSGPIRGRATWELNKLAKRAGIAGMATNGYKIMECPLATDVCLCTHFFPGDQTTKSCARGELVEKYCNSVHEDPQSYCKYWNTDLCNDEPVMWWIMNDAFEGNAKVPKELAPTNNEKKTNFFWENPNVVD
jgi:hypothetical protein